MKHTNTHTGFTLIELLVSITIFGIMMISVMSIFLFSSQMSSRVELNRVMQENIKNVMEDIAENVRKQHIQGVRPFSGNCSMPSGGTPIVASDGLCTGGAEYFVGVYDDSSDNWSRVSNIATDCGDLDSLCRVLKKEGVDIYPLTNSFIHFENISFVVTNTDVPMVTINMTTRPPYNKGLLPEIIKNNTVYTQTTISEKLIDTH